MASSQEISKKSQAKKTRHNSEKTSKQALDGVAIEKDPTVCLVYHLKDLSKSRYLAKSEYISLNIDGQLSRAQTEIPRDSNPKICAEGDSWINILHEISRYFGYQMTFFDVIEQMGYYTRSVAWPGDTFEQMLSEQDYRQLIGSGIFEYFIFSGGGNDILGGGALTRFLRHRADVTGSDAERYLYLDLVKAAIRRLEAGYMALADDVEALSRPHNTKMLVHGYDVPVPRKDGMWLGGPFARRGFDLKKDKYLINGILTYLVDELYDSLHRVEAKKKNVKVVDLRGCVAGRWNDELHPRKTASVDIAARFTAIIGPNKSQKSAAFA